ncbi:damage-control phosphatase ARMT1-like [Littorina saxatilis]|uniref:Sugar phosphate phosphatase n=1 Tax=Littorina saxatilis TaxID=31220 RepID=A0AAN9BFA4_9CAEN
MGTQDPPPALSAKNESSFAYYTINARLPVILARIADSLCRKKERIIAKYGQESSEDIKFVIGHLSKLRYEVQTNKAIQPLESNAPDVQAWNRELATQTAAQGGEPPKWYSATWLYVETYMYRALNDYVALTKTMKSFDIFGEQKQIAYTDAEVPVSSLMSYLDEVTANLQKGSKTDIDELFSEFIQVALWGNKCDLSISHGAENSQKQCLLEQLSHLKPNILADDTRKTLAALRSAAGARNHQAGRVDIVLDNAGFELVTDLTFAEVLLATGLASCVHFHGKTMPWFVSDVTQDDFSWTLDTMSASSNTAVSKLGAKWKSRLQDGSWVYKAHSFWTLPYDYSLMKKHAQDLYADLAKADLVFFKGDLNYRKLVGDRDWNPTTPFQVSLRGFHPAPLCSLRALKADTVAGLRPGVAEEVAVKDEKWQVNGSWTTISFCGERVS